MLAFIVGLCGFFHIKSSNDLYGYWALAASYNLVWKEFAFRRVRAGDSAAELVRRFPAPSQEEFGRYAVYEYEPRPPGHLFFTSLAVIARDGRICQKHLGLPGATATTSPDEKSVKDIFERQIKALL